MGFRKQLMGTGIFAETRWSRAGFWSGMGLGDIPGRVSDVKPEKTG